MNYYPHHIGDFNNATRHLSRVERSIYRDLIELYYDAECCLPHDFDLLCRKVLARSDEERTAVEQTLNEFFIETDDGWLHERCDREIEDYRASTSQKSAAGKASAAKRAEKRQQMLNERPTSVERTYNKRATNQEPRTKNQEPEVKPSSGKSSPTLREEALGILDYLNLKADRNYQPVDQNVNFIVDRLKGGFTAEQCRFVIDNKCLQWLTDPKMSEYLRPATLFNATKFAQYTGEPMRQPVQAAPANRLGKSGQETAAAAERLMARYATQGAIHEAE